MFGNGMRAGSEEESIRGHKPFRNLLGLIAAWFAVLALMAALILYRAGPKEGMAFLSRENFETILRQTTIVGFGAVAMTFVIVSGMIDLSVGSVVALVTVVIAYAIQEGAQPVVAAMAGILVGVAAGLCNGGIITKLKVSPFIVTLGTLMIFRGVAKGLANNQKIDAPFTWMKDLLARLAPGEQWQLAPIGVWLLVAVAILGSVMLGKTVFGRQLTAVGANEEAARLAGIDPSATRIKVFLLAGLLIGLAGMMQFSRLTVGDPTVAQGLELEIIAAVVIGGASLSGGQGNIWGSLLGALIISTIRAGCSQAGFPNNVQEIVAGSIIVLAVALDRYRSRKLLSATIAP